SPAGRRSPRTGCRRCPRRRSSCTRAAGPPRPRPAAASRRRTALPAARGRRRPRDGGAEPQARAHPRGPRRGGAPGAPAMVVGPPMVVVVVPVVLCAVLHLLGGIAPVALELVRLVGAVVLELVRLVRLVLLLLVLLLLLTLLHVLRRALALLLAAAHGLVLRAAPGPALSRSVVAARAVHAAEAAGARRAEHN